MCLKGNLKHIYSEATEFSDFDFSGRVVLGLLPEYSGFFLQKAHSLVLNLWVFEKEVRCLPYI